MRLRTRTKKSVANLGKTHSWRALCRWYDIHGRAHMRIAAIHSTSLDRKPYWSLFHPVRMQYPSACQTREMIGCGAQPQAIARLSTTSVRSLHAPVKYLHPVQFSGDLRYSRSRVDEGLRSASILGRKRWSQVGCFVVAARRCSRMARAHSVHRRPDTEVGLRLVRASGADLRKGESGVIRCRCEQLESALAALRRRPTSAERPVGCPTCGARQTWDM
jgi:hypothetical protein